MSTKPLVCTQNSQSHVDYGIPILATKSTDYRTCTGTYHRNIPNIPQHFDCRVKANIKPGLREKDIALRDDVYSTYTKDYHSNWKLISSCDRAMQNDHVDSIRHVQERVKKYISPQLKPELSLMKDSFRMNYHKPDMREVIPPALTSHCDISGLYRPLQPSIAPDQKGHWKYLDIYMSENKLQYIPYSKDQMEKASAKPKVVNFLAPGVRPPVPPNKFLSRGQKRVPNFGMTTECQAQYRPQTYSDLCAYTHEHGVDFEDALPEAGAWQSLCPPGMYCTENCHLGSGWPLRSVVNIGKGKSLVPHQQPCCEG